MTERDSDNDARGEGRARDLFEVARALAVATAILVLGIALFWGYVHYPVCVGSIECAREGIELVVVPIGVIAGALLRRRLELTTSLEASRIRPLLPLLELGVLLDALLLLMWMWSEGYRWYGPARLSGAAVLASLAFVVGRFHLRTSAVLAGFIGVPAILAAGIIAVHDTS